MKVNNATEKYGPALVYNCDETSLMGCSGSRRFLKVRDKDQSKKINNVKSNGKITVSMLISMEGNIHTTKIM